MKENNLHFSCRFFSSSTEIKAPKAVWEQVKKFWDNNKDKKNWKNENWPKGNTYTNHVSLIILWLQLYVMYIACLFISHLSLLCMFEQLLSFSSSYYFFMTVDCANVYGKRGGHTPTRCRFEH